MKSGTYITVRADECYRHTLLLSWTMSLTNVRLMPLTMRDATAVRKMDSFASTSAVIAASSPADTCCSSGRPFSNSRLAMSA